MAKKRARKQKSPLVPQNAVVHDLTSEDETENKRPRHDAALAVEAADIDRVVQISTETEFRDLLSSFSEDIVMVVGGIDDLVEQWKQASFDEKTDFVQNVLSCCMDVAQRADTTDMQSSGFADVAQITTSTPVGSSKSGLGFMDQGDEAVGISPDDVELTSDQIDELISEILEDEESFQEITTSDEFIEHITEDDAAMQDMMVDAELAGLEDFDATVDKYKTLDPSVRPNFMEYLLRMTETDASIIEETDNFADIESPSGSYHTDVAWVWHWPPKEPGLKPYSSIGGNDINRSLKQARKIFTNHKNFFAFDLVPRRYGLFKDGKQRSAQELYENEVWYPDHFWLAKKNIESLQATSDNPVLITVGKPAAEFLHDTFTVTKDKLIINGKTWTVIEIPHFQYLRAFAKSPALDRTHEKLRKVSIDHPSLGIDNDAMSKLFNAWHQRARGQLQRASDKIQGEFAESEQIPSALNAYLKDKKRLELGWTAEKMQAVRQQYGLAALASAVLWSDPAQHEAASKRMEEYWSRHPELRRNLSERSKKLWSDPILHDALCAKLKERWSDPVRRHEASERSKKWWSVPAYREAQKRRMKEQWKDPAFRKVMSEAAKTRMSGAAPRKDAAAVMRNLWLRPGFRKNFSEQRKKLWANPAYREARRRNEEKRALDPVQFQAFFEQTKEIWSSAVSTTDFSEAIDEIGKQSESEHLQLLIQKLKEYHEQHEMVARTIDVPLIFYDTLSSVRNIRRLASLTGWAKKAATEGRSATRAANAKPIDMETTQAANAKPINMKTTQALGRASLNQRVINKTGFRCFGKDSNGHPQCPKIFDTKTDLRAHMRLYHKQDGSSAYDDKLAEDNFQEVAGTNPRLVFWGCPVEGCDFTTTADRNGCMRSRHVQKAHPDFKIKDVKSIPLDKDYNPITLTPALRPKADKFKCYIDTCGVKKSLKHRFKEHFEKWHNDVVYDPSSIIDVYEDD